MAKTTSAAKAQSKRITKKDNVVKDTKLEKIEEAIEKADTDIDIKEIKMPEPDMSEVKDVIETINTVTEKEKELTDLLENNTDKAEDFIEEELKKVEETEKKIEKITKSSTNNTTYTWNGMYGGY